MVGSLQEKLLELLQPVITAMGFELWGLELHGSGNKFLLRVYIDAPDGVTADDCAQVSYQINGVLAVEQLITTDYRLEVSSPGVERSLYTEDQYKRYVGGQVYITLASQKNGRRNYKGELQQVTATGINLLVDGKKVELLFAEIKSAHLIAH